MCWTGHLGTKGMPVSEEELRRGYELLATLHERLPEIHEAMRQSILSEKAAECYQDEKITPVKMEGNNNETD